mgnify:CR=1 FL=1
MKGWFIRLFMVLTLTMFLGCASTSNNIQQQHALHSELLASDVDSLSTTYDTVKALVDEKQIKDKIFNDKDWDKLLDVDASINLLLLKYKVIVKADITEFDVEDVQLMWRITKSSYNKARDVVISHLDVFDTKAQELFTEFDNKAADASKTIDKLLENPSKAEVTQVASLVVTVLSLALKIVSVTVV